MSSACGFAFQMFLKGWRLIHFELSEICRRVLETLAVMHFVFLWILLPIIAVWFPFYIFAFTQFWPVVILYLAWTVYDWRTPRMGARSWKWYKTHKVWRYFSNYFPLHLIKTADLPADRNYIIGSHPHGVLSIGAFTAMTTDATGFPKLFPGLQSTILTLNGQFYFPFRRDLGLALGGAEASKESLTYLLKNPGRGRAVAIVIGGATEALDAHPGSYKLNLMKRRGFCRYALICGADLVPMFNFGENDIFDQYEFFLGSRLRKVQQKIKDIAGFCPPLFRGRGLFNNSFGLLPFRRSITSVIGAPIRVEKVDNPTEGQINNLHAQYCASLIKLFEDHKHRHNIPAHIHLTIY